MSVAQTGRITSNAKV